MPRRYVSRGGFRCCVIICIPARDLSTHIKINRSGHEKSFNLFMQSMNYFAVREVAVPRYTSASYPKGERRMYRLEKKEKKK